MSTMPRRRARFARRRRLKPLPDICRAFPAVAPALAEAIANPVALAGIGFTVHLDPVEGGYKASVTIDARNITLQPKDGKWTGSLQFLVVVGKVEQLTTIPLSFTEATFHQIQEKGLVLGARVKTPPGTMGFSMGFRDIPSGRSEERRVGKEGRSRWSPYH